MDGVPLGDGDAMADDTGRRDATERPPTPSWVKVIGIAILAVVILAIIILVVGGGRHGPGMHGSGQLGLSTAAIVRSDGA